MSDFILLKTYLNRYEAETAKGLLKEKGIEVLISADDCGGFRPDISLGMGNVRLLVPKEEPILEIRDAPKKKK